MEETEVIAKVMKIFFNMSFREDIELGLRIYKEIENLGHKHTSNLFSSEQAAKSFYEFSSKEHGEHYEKLFSKLIRSDIIVVEVSIHSLTVGSIIQKGLDSRIPILALCRERQRKPFLDGIEYSEDRLLVVEYSNESLPIKLKEGLDYLEETLSTRFTMILPSDISKYLETLSHRGITRSEYIRNLILKDMRKLVS